MINKKEGNLMGKQEWTHKQRAFLLLALVSLLMGIAGLAVGVFNVGSALLCGFSAYLAAVVVMERRWKRREHLLTTVGVFVVAVLVLHAAVWNYFAYGRPPQTSGEATVIVLGCKVNDGQPSLMLRRRLTAAWKYLEQNPQANCVVSGGMGKNETSTEASVMKQFLVDSGIDTSRIYEEDRSVNTDTNIRNSLALIERENLSENLIICTDGFHQLRAWLYIRRYGAEARAVSGRTPVMVIPSYAVRELCGIVKMFVIG